MRVEGVCGAVELLRWEEVGFDGRVVLPNSVYAVIAVARRCLMDGFLALGRRDTLADGGDVTVEEGIEAFGQDATSGTREGGIKGGARRGIEGYHLVYHGLSRSECGSSAKSGLTRMP